MFQLQMLHTVQWDGKMIMTCHRSGKRHLVAAWRDRENPRRIRIRIGITCNRLGLETVCRIRVYSAVSSRVMGITDVMETKSLKRPVFWIFHGPKFPTSVICYVSHRPSSILRPRSYKTSLCQQSLHNSDVILAEFASCDKNEFLTKQCIDRKASSWSKNITNWISK
jgi:hypothetical protein